ncbi:uncharacterized protein LOC128886051 isoform X1 [Hylaeus anthracinus]|uniref:uncharacterized protein LOC128886051 isoform X1 n=1 Tax=Hylaeus anthracinus TaxID=313031 RepID=UPI0023B8BD80|nr:uncharacterized protein LOC128886051 isoform X1 [Hylaeus anthracinus]
MGETYNTLNGEYSSSWDEPEVQEWKKRAREIHGYFYRAFEGNQWDIYESSQYNLLRVKICYALFGQPNDENNNAEKIEDTYSKEQRDRADQIKNTIVEVYNTYTCSGKLNVGIIFVHCKTADNEFYVPIFRVKIIEEDCYYVDTYQRVYKSWSDWQNNNQLPMMKYCFPQNGFYTCSGSNDYKYDPECEPDVSFGTSPACNLLSHVGRLMDTGIGITGLVAASVGVVSLFTPLAPAMIMYAGVAGTTSALYGAGRSAYVLIDKGTHNQSLADLESVMCGLSILMLPLHAGKTAVNTTLTVGARAGRTFTSLQMLGATFLNVTSVALDSSMLIIGFVNLYKKYENNTLGKMDILHFSISVFFFTNTLIEPKTASAIINEAQSDYFKQYRTQMTDAEAQKTFDKFIRKNHKNISKGAKIAKTINNINNPNQFFKNVGTKSSIKVRGKSGRDVTINDQLKINPNRFSQLNPQTAKKLVNAAKKKTHTQPDEYRKHCNQFMSEERIALKTRRRETLQKMTELFELEWKDLKNVKINNVKMFSRLTGSDLDRIKTVLADTARNYDKNIVNAAIAVVENSNCKTIHEFGAHIKLIALESKNRTRSEFRSFLADLQWNPETRRQFMAGVTKDCETAKNIMSNANIKFNDELLATYHYRKHGAKFGKNVTMNVYLDDIPKDLFQDKNLFRDVYDQNGKNRIRTYADKDGYKFGVLRTSADGTSCVATVFSNEKFFQNWKTKWEDAQQYLQFCTAQYNDSKQSLTSSFNIFMKNVLYETGFLINTVNVHNRSGTQNLNMFEGNSADNERLRALADLLATMTRGEEAD